MKRFTLAILLLIVLLFVAATAHSQNLFTVTCVSDGDTTSRQGCGITFKVRLERIDAPEKGTKKRPGQPYAEQARRYLQSLVLNKPVTIKQVGPDGFNLVLGAEHLNDRNINLGMIKQGYAEVYRGKHRFDTQPAMESGGRCQG